MSVSLQVMHSRRQQKPRGFSRIVRLWKKLTPQQRHQLKGYYWAVSINLCLILLLAAITLHAKKEIGIVLNLTVSDGVEAEASFDLSESIDTSAIEELETMETLPADLELDKPQLADVPLEISDLVPTTAELGTDLGALASQAAAESASSLAESQLIQTVDSRIAAAGGELEGPIRISLAFDGDDDLDLHVSYVPKGRTLPRNRNTFAFPQDNGARHVFFAFRQSEHAALDVDANANGIMENPCENIIFKTVPKSATYTIALDNYAERGIVDETPYTIVVKYGRKTKIFEGKLGPIDRMKVIWVFKYSS